MGDASSRGRPVGGSCYGPLIITSLKQMGTSSLSACILLAFEEEVVTMSTLTVRNLDSETTIALKALGAEHGRSMEAEVRVILAAAVRARTSEAVEGLGSRIRTRFDGIEWDGGARRDDRPRAADVDVDA